MTKSFKKNDKIIPPPKKKKTNIQENIIPVQCPSQQEYSAEKKPSR